MHRQLTRRNFLVQTGCVCGGALAAARWGQLALAADSRPMWLATCRDAVTRPLGQKDIWSALKAVGAEGVEIDTTPDLTLQDLYHPTIKYTLATDAGIRQVADDAKAAGVEITGFCMHNQFAQQPDKEVERCIRLANAAKALGVSTIRIDVVPGSLERSAFEKVAVDALKKVIAGTEGTGIRFGVENHSNTTNDPKFLDILFDGVGSDRLGLTLDTGNFYWFGHPLSKVYEFVEKYAKRVFHTHCKNIRYPAGESEKQRPMGWKYDQYGCPIYAGDVDYAKVVAILTKAGYRNDLCIENEFLGKLSPTEATKTLAKEITLLKKLRGNA